MRITLGLLIQKSRVLSPLLNEILDFHLPDQREFR